MAEQISSSFNIIDKKLSKYINKEVKTIIKKSQKVNKPKGIAMPTRVTNELCIFMEKPINTKIARTDASKYLMQYIKTNNLFDANNKKIIVPDSKLLSFIGNIENKEEITYFNIQKHLNKHFIG